MTDMEDAYVSLFWRSGLAWYIFQRKKRGGLELRLRNVPIARELPGKYGVLCLGPIYCVFDVDKNIAKRPGYIEFSSLSKLE